MTEHTLNVSDTLDTPAGRRALATRDVPAVFGLLRDAGVPQRTIAHATDMSQSEVSEVLHGRRVMAYDVLVRIAAGLGIERGWLGLAGVDGYADPDGTEYPAMDDDMIRRRFLGLASTALLGSAVVGEAGGLPLLTARDGARLGAADIGWMRTMTTRLRDMEYEHGGASVAGAARGVAQQVIGSLRASPQHRELQVAASELVRSAGWILHDAGQPREFWQYLATSMDLAREAGDGSTVSKCIESAGRVEIMSGNHQQAAKLFELLSARLKPDATRWGLLADAYAPLSPDSAQAALTRLRDSEGADTPDAIGCVGHASLALGDYEAAVAAYSRSLPHRYGRVAIQETAPLAIAHLRAGEVRTGTQVAERSVDIASGLRSTDADTVMRRLSSELAKQKDTTCRDLARRCVAVA